MVRATTVEPSFAFRVMPVQALQFWNDATKAAAARAMAVRIEECLIMYVVIIYGNMLDAKPSSPLCLLAYGKQGTTRKMRAVLGLRGKIFIPVKD